MSEPNDTAITFECPVCKEDFSDDPNHQKAPINGTCGHKVCGECIKQMQVAKMEESGRRRVVNLECPLKCSRNAFHAEKPVVDVMYCNLLRLFRRHHASSSRGGRNTFSGDSPSVSNTSISSNVGPQSRSARDRHSTNDFRPDDFCSYSNIEMNKRPSDLLVSQDSQRNKRSKPTFYPSDSPSDSD